MDNNPAKPVGVAHPHIHTLKNILLPGGRKRRVVTMAQLER
jgi:hypothetical protein